MLDGFGDCLFEELYPVDPADIGWCQDEFPMELGFLGTKNNEQRYWWASYSPSSARYRMF